MQMIVRFFISFSDCLAKRDMGLESELINKILSNYSKFGRPIADVSKPVNVTISFFLTQLMSLVSFIHFIPFKSLGNNCY